MDMQCMLMDNLLVHFTLHVLAVAFVLLVLWLLFSRTRVGQRLLARMITRP